MFLAIASVRAGTPRTLKEVSAGRWLIGTAVTTQQLQDAKTVRLITTQFDHLTAEYDFFPQFLQPRPDQFTFEEADKIVSFAAAHHLPMTGHMLVWGQFTPAWMYQSSDGKPLPRERALANMKKHIETVVQHFKTKVDSWDVVNEAISDLPDEYLRDTPARRAIGEDYIQRAFEFAHTADPAAKLYYNDYNVEDPAKLPKVLKLVHSLIEKKVRLDAVGIEGHWLLNFPSTHAIDTAISQIEKEKIEVYITELDVDVLPRNKEGADLNHVQTEGENPYTNGLPNKVADALATRYAGLFAVFNAHRGTVSSVTFWGVGNGQSWLNGYPVKGRTNYPLLFDRTLQPTPAYKAVIEELSK